VKEKGKYSGEGENPVAAFKREKGGRKSIAMTKANWIPEGNISEKLGGLT